MAQFNTSHAKDATPYEAFRQIDAEIRGRARIISRGFLDIVKLAGFELMEPVRLRDRKTGIRIEIRPTKEAESADV